MQRDNIEGTLRSDDHINGGLSTQERLRGLLSVGGGVSSYNELEDLPTLNGETIMGDMTIWQPKNFSTSEQNTGIKWIDGKDIYFKTFQIDNGTFNSNYDGILIAENIDYIDTLIAYTGTVKHNQNNAISSLNGLPTTGWSYGIHINPSKQLVLWSGNYNNVQSISGYSLITCILFYTKTL